MVKSRRLLLGLTVIVVLAATVSRDAISQPVTPAPAPKAAGVPKPGLVIAPQPSLPVGIEQSLYLIRSTLLTLNDANHSGNYTVMRDLAAPEFQARNTAADLSQIFSDLRRRNFDLYGAALLAPQLTAEPALDADKRLHLAGFFATRPQRISFDLSFEVVGGQWRLFGIAIATPDAPALPVAAAPSTMPPARQAGPAPKKP